MLDSHILTILLLRIWSSRGHAADISEHNTFIKTDILCLTESQICTNDDTSDVRERT